MNKVLIKVATLYLLVQIAIHLFTFGTATYYWARAEIDRSKLSKSEKAYLDPNKSPTSRYWEYVNPSFKLR